MGPYIVDIVVGFSGGLLLGLIIGGVLWLIVNREPPL